MNLQRQALKSTFEATILNCPDSMEAHMAKVTGIGGIFFKARDPKALAEWYAKHLGLAISDFGGTMFAEDASRPGFVLWSPFPADTAYFAPSDKAFMVNFRVDDLRGLLAQLRAAGVDVDEKVEEHDYGRFGWIMDPEGNRVELWEPAASKEAVRAQ